jgi:trans-aconitate 2-methyltransferase
MAAVSPQGGAAHWDPGQYRRFADERARPFHDLLARIPPGDAVRSVVDLGCGAGELTRSLLQRWPRAQVIGLDHSPEMLAAAHALPANQRLVFTAGDIATWAPQMRFDVIIANASLHWLHNHEQLMQRLVGILAPAGILAVQMPYNQDEPCHSLYEELRAASHWRVLLGEPRRQYGTQAPAWYFARLSTLGCIVELWETIYHHVLADAEAVVEWVKGLLLRPTLATLEPLRRREFMAEYTAKVSQAYPREAHGTLLRYRRLFFIARKLS